MEFTWRGRRYLTPLPIPVIWGIFIYTFFIISFLALWDQIWALGIPSLVLGLIFYALFIEHRAVVLNDSFLRYELYRKVARDRIVKAIVELNSSNATGLPMLHGYLKLDDGREVAPDFLFAFVFRPPPWDDLRVMRQTKEIAAWAGVPFEVIE